MSIAKKKENCHLPRLYALPLLDAERGGRGDKKDKCPGRLAVKSSKKRQKLLSAANK